MVQWRPVLRRRAFLPSAVNLARYIALGRAEARITDFIPVLGYRYTREELLRCTRDELGRAA